MSTITGQTIPLTAMMPYKSARYVHLAAFRHVTLGHNPQRVMETACFKLLTRATPTTAALTCPECVGHARLEGVG